MSARLARPATVRRSVAVLAAALALSACAPGSTTTTADPAASAATGVGTDPVTLTILVSTPDVTLFDALGSAFHGKYPNVTVKITSQDYNSLVTNTPRILAGTGAPDLVRIASFGNLVTDHLLTNLDGYAAAYGWTSWPQSQFASTRVAANGTERGSGSLYGVGPGFGLTGVYYNTELAARIGMTKPPATLAEFEQLLAKAKDAGLLPILINGKDGGTVFPLQNLQMDYAGGPQQVQAWNYDSPGADINTPATVRAAATLQQWAASGHFAPDVDSVDQTEAPARFAAGTGVFFPSGNWQAPGLDKAGPGKFGFFLFPPLKEGDHYTAMTAADTLAIPTRAAHATVAAAFLNFIQTDPGARTDTVTLGGVVPAGPANAPAPSAPDGSVVAATVTAFRQLLDSDGLVDFMANATASIQVNTLLPQTQLLMAGKTTPEAFAGKVQSDYDNALEH
ncbi:ABC transporter substrate-binding protein [Dactylosporangium sp. CA-092794]|uniref:ABC transporter substrate-binding protein n=1 Tax=Dactylosporangium sp. CA-092794 TaxID=3239929 RepID=UPI003D90ED77